jgi:hypothetical protein
MLNISSVSKHSNEKEIMIDAHTPLENPEINCLPSDFIQIELLDIDTVLL